MKHEVFSNKNIDPSELYDKIKKYLVENGFRVESEDVIDKFWDLRAKKSGLKNIVSGTIRDIDVIIAGDKEKFEVQLKTGAWGRDILIPTIEGIAVFGTIGLVAAPAEAYFAHKFEEDLWKYIKEWIG